MNKSLHSNTSKAIHHLSDSLNNNGAYKLIQDIATAYFDKEIHNDSCFWHRLEDTIIDMIKEHKKKTDIWIN
jgi:hypothetical protein